MYGIADYWAFVIAVIVFLAIPGPGNLAIITSTSKGRIWGGLAATFGVIAGDQVLMWAAVAGVAALLAAQPGAIRWRRLFGLPGREDDSGQARRCADSQDGAAPVLPSKPVDHLAQSEGDCVLHGFLSAFCGPAKAPRLADLCDDGHYDCSAHLPLLHERGVDHAFCGGAYAQQSQNHQLAQ
jgi:hypothetical protein